MIEKLKIKIRVCNFNSKLDQIDHSKKTTYRYIISGTTKYLELWMDEDVDEMDAFVDEIGKYHHIDNYEIINKRYKYIFQNGNIRKIKCW